MRSIYNNITSLFLCLTDTCNLKCKYCFVTQKPNYMSFEVARDSILFILENSSYSNRSRLTVTLFGGEPLLMYDSVIVPLVNYIKKNNLNINLGITTNGILLNKDKLEFFKANNISLLLSIDGNKVCQDENRPFKDKSISSFDVLEPKLSLILKYFPETLFRSTLTDNTVPYLFDNILFAKSKGFKRIAVCPDESAKYEDYDFDKIEESIIKYSLYFIDLYRSGLNKYSRSFIEYQPLITGIKEALAIMKSDKESRIGTQMCGLGINSAAINYEGAIFGCQELVTKGYVDNPYYIGNIYTGIDQLKHNNLLTLYRTKELTCEDPNQCINCIKRFICSKGFCHAGGYLYSGSATTKSKVRCMWDCLHIKYGNLIIHTLKDNESFKRDFMNEKL